MTPEEFENQLAELLGHTPSPDENLLESGLDSIRMMTLAQRCDLSLMDLVEDPTLDAWLRLIGRPA